MKLTLKEVMEIKRISSKQIADKVGLDRAMVTEFSNGVRIPNEQHTVAIEKAVGMEGMIDWGFPVLRKPGERLKQWRKRLARHGTGSEDI